MLAVPKERKQEWRRASKEKEKVLPTEVPPEERRGAKDWTHLNKSRLKEKVSLINSREKEVNL